MTVHRSQALTGLRTVVRALTRPAQRRRLAAAGAGAAGERSTPSGGGPARRRLPAGVVLAAVFWLVTLVYVVGAVRLQTTARVLPLVVSIPTLVALSANLAVEWRKGKGPPSRPDSEADLVQAARAYAPQPDGGLAGEGTPSPAGAPVDVRSELRMIAWVALLLVLTLLAGVTVAFPVFLIAYLRIQGGESWLWAIVITAGVTVFLAILFRQILQLPMYQGVFG